ncbi:hypothetical protein H6P81_018400 [Aristolochia fimbriata]|uniref:F-box associated beta-propeller type 3 domain-containing protein n=1 Tax=Aristolochia fimbriata TaxID=158543 RepID=A0AAV7E458_ARIFI|nr:hypothetical protein H6P81_018400 [Aristolochia fimbriata]
MESLDADVLRHIFAFLPAKTLGVLKCTKKSWSAIISDPYFVAMQAKRSSSAVLGLFHASTNPVGGRTMYVTLESGSEGPKFRNLRGVSIAASCLGLLLCFKPKSPNSYYYVCNPATNETRVLPRLNRFTAGLGLAAAPDAYTVVSINPRHVGPGSVVYRFFTFSQSSTTNKWRLARAALQCPAGEICRSAGPVYLRGVIHWLRASSTGDVLTFEVEREHARVTELPRAMRASLRSEYSNVWFGAVEGSLCLALVEEGLAVVLWETCDSERRQWRRKRRIVAAVATTRVGNGVCAGVIPAFFDGERAVVATQSDRSSGLKHQVIRTLRPMDILGSHDSEKSYPKTEKKAKPGTLYKKDTTVEIDTYVV